MRRLRHRAGTTSRAVLIIAGGLAAAACSQTVQVGPSRTLRLAVTEYRVVPQSVRSRPGQLTLLVENRGRLTHNLAISDRGTIVGQTPPLHPGGRAYLILTLGPGSYLMTSTLFSDQALGTYGTLVVMK